MSKIPEKIIRDLNKILLKLNLEATTDYIEELLKNTKVKKDMIKINGVDTVEREIFLDILSHKLTGRYWPCNGDTDEQANDFWEKFINAVKKENSLSFIKK